MGSDQTSRPSALASGPVDDDLTLAARVAAARRAATVARHRARARWYLRRLRSVGRDPQVGGSPNLEATDLVAGDEFRVWSGHRQTLVCGWGRIRVGDRVFLNSGVVIFSTVAVTIGDDVALAGEVYVMDSSSHGIEGRPAHEAPVSIGAGSWIGARSIVLPGVTIGKRVMVAAGSVVTRDVPDDCLVGGNPARVIRKLDYPSYCRRAWHDVFCHCPGSLFGAAPDAAVRAELMQTADGREALEASDRLRAESAT